MHNDPMTPGSNKPENPVPFWLRFWAFLTLIAALPPILFGAEVTTKQVGMVDPVGFRLPSELLGMVMRDRAHFLEHGHRLAAMVVGIAAIVLAFGLFFGTKQGSVRWLGLVALVAIGFQGILGIFRVNLHAIFGSSMALVHGCSAQLVLAILAGIALATTSTWQCSRKSERLPWMPLLVVLLVYIQIVLGAAVRHYQDRAAQKLHILGAFVAALAILWLIYHQWNQRRGWSIVLAILLGFQIALGVEAWFGRFAIPAPPIDMWPEELIMPRPRLSPAIDILRTMHFMVGAGLFVSTVIVSLLSLRLPLRQTPESRALAGLRMEEVA